MSPTHATRRCVMEICLYHVFVICLSSDCSAPKRLLLGELFIAFSWPRYYYSRRWGIVVVEHLTMVDRPSSPARARIRHLHVVANTVATTRHQQPPRLGERSGGHSVIGTLAVIAEQQPLLAENVWRVVLAGEAVGRLVSRARDGALQLLQLTELTDAQLDIYEAAMRTSRAV